MGPTSSSSRAIGAQVLTLRFRVACSAAGVTMGTALEAFGALALCNKGEAL